MGLNLTGESMPVQWGVLPTVPRDWTFDVGCSSVLQPSLPRRNPTRRAEIKEPLAFSLQPLAFVKIVADSPQTLVLIWIQLIAQGWAL